MATAINVGVSNTETAATEGRRKIDMADAVYLLDGKQAPLVSFLTSPSLKKVTAFSPKVEWLQSTILPKFTKCTEALDDSETGVDVTTGTGKYFRPGDIVLNVFTLERMFVSSISTDTLTVVRGWGSTAAASVGAADELYRLGNAAAEGATLSAIRQVATVAAYNYTQIVTNAGGFTGTEVATDLYGGPEPAQEIKKKMIEHAVDWESNLFWGSRAASTDGVTGHPVRTMGGLAYYIQSKITHADGALTETIWTNFLESASRYGSDEKVVFMGPTVNAAIAKFARDRIAVNTDGSSLKKWGVSLNSYQSPQGNNFKFVVKSDWADWTPTSATFSPSGCAFVVDMQDLQLAVMKGRDTKLLGDQQANDEDAVKFQIKTEQSMRIGNEKNHAILAGVTS